MNSNGNGNVNELDTFMNDIINEVNKETQMQFENASKIINETINNSENSKTEDELFDLENTSFTSNIPLNNSMNTSLISNISTMNIPTSHMSYTI